MREKSLLVGASVYMWGWTRLKKLKCALYLFIDLWNKHETSINNNVSCNVQVQQQQHLKFMHMMNRWESSNEFMIWICMRQWNWICEWNNLRCNEWTATEPLHAFNGNYSFLYKYNQGDAIFWTFTNQVITNTCSRLPVANTIILIEFAWFLFAHNTNKQLII